MGHPMLPNWLRWLLPRLSNSLGMPTYLPTYHLTNLPIQPHISHLPLISHFPSCILTYLPLISHLPSYILTYLPTYKYLPTYLLLFTYHHTYVPTYFLLLTIYCTYLPTSCTSHLPSYILMYPPTSYLPTPLPTVHHAAY